MAMKKVRRNEMIGNTSPCVTRSKKRAESDPFYKFPLDLIIKILLMLPAESIAKLKFVSKLWSSIICRKDFTDLYLTRSSTRPRLLFSVDSEFIQKRFFHFSSEDDPSSAHHRVSCYTRNSDDFSPSIRGLICCLNRRYRNGIVTTQVMIGNPTTGQFIALPKLIEARKIRVLSFFGYDHVNDQYKVLCMTVESGYPEPGELQGFVTTDHQVFTLGSKQKWRKIECKHLHFVYPFAKGICNNGAVYYLSWINGVQSLMCFDLRSENFNVIKLPENVEVEIIANYKETIAVTNKFSDGRLDLWVLDDVSKQEWSKVSIMIQSFTNLVGNNVIRFRGTLGTGELIFAPGPYYIEDPFFLLCYDLEKSSARKVLIEGFGTSASTCASVFLGHIDSPMFLSSI